MTSEARRLARANYESESQYLHIVAHVTINCVPIVFACYTVKSIEPTIFFTLLQYKVEIITAARFLSYTQPYCLALLGKGRQTHSRVKSSRLMPTHESECPPE